MGISYVSSLNQVGHDKKKRQKKTPTIDAGKNKKVVCICGKCDTHYHWKISMRRTGLKCPMCGNQDDQEKFTHGYFGG